MKGQIDMAVGIDIHVGVLPGVQNDKTPGRRDGVTGARKS
jgi:hypothetical protein